MAWAALVPTAGLGGMGWEKPLAVLLLSSVPRRRGAGQAAAGKLGIASLKSNISVHLTLLLQGEGLLKSDVLPSTPLLRVCSTYACVCQPCTSAHTYVTFIHACAYFRRAQCGERSPVARASSWQTHTRLHVVLTHQHPQ